MKNRQGLTIAALIVAIVGLSIGFAAFSNTLNISSTASVNPDASSLKVVFANNTDVNSLNTNPVQVFSASEGASGTPGTINNEALNGPTLTGLKASFTQPGQSVVYKLNVVNAGKLKAYLTDIVFGTTGNPAKAVSCTVATKDSNNQDIPVANQATESLVNAACEGISISVKIGELDAKTSSGSLNNLELNVAGYKEVVITISYASGSAYVDGPMNVAFGDIEINAASVGAQSQGGGETPSEPQSSNVELPDYLVTAQGEITEYIGAGGSVTIPSTLPVYVESQYEYVKLDDCIPMAMQYASMDETTATSACTQVKEDVELGKTDASTGASEITQQFYSSLKSAGAIVQGYEATGQNVTVTSIGEGAFQNARLTSVTIPSTVETIGVRAFYINEIATLDLSNASSLTTIGEVAFSDNYLTSVNVPDSVTTIGSSAFDNNNITSVTIGSGLTTIGSIAFGDGSVSSNGKNYGPNVITSVTINALKANVSGFDYTTFGYDSNANCTNTVSNDPKSNSCITWVNG